MLLLTGFCKPLNVCFNMKINKWLHLLTGFWEIQLSCHLFRKRIDLKNLPLRQQPNCISCSMVCKIFFAPNSSIFRKCLRKDWKNEAKTKGFLLSANANFPTDRIGEKQNHKTHDYDCKGGTFSQLVTNLKNLVAIGIVTNQI